MPALSFLSNTTFTMTIGLESYMYSVSQKSSRILSNMYNSARVLYTLRILSISHGMPIRYALHSILLPRCM